MIDSVKELVAILVVTLPVWLIGRSFFEAFCGSLVFELRRKTWLIITILGLISPNIWIYSIFAIPVIFRAAKIDPNPAALFIILFFAVPGAAVQIPSFGVELFSMSHQRLLVFVLLGSSFRAGRFGWAANRDKIFDLPLFLLLLFITLRIFLESPNVSLTHTIRQLFLGFVDTLVIYVLFSRLQNRAAAIRDCMVSWVFAALLLSTVAIFESVKGWLLYTGISARWGAENVFAFLLREGALRAQASTGHSLTLGIWLAVAWVFLLLVQRSSKKSFLNITFAALILGGLWSCAARGAWLAALASTLIYFGMDPGGFSKGLKGILAVCIFLALILVSPLGAPVISYLPFVGTVDAGNVDYRIRVFEVCMDLVRQYPFFGNPSAISYMEELRQGQGIIDLVNGYLQIAVFHGLITLSLFVSLLFVGLARALIVWKDVRMRDPDLAYIGASLIAAMIGTMIFIATAGIDPMTYMILGLLSSYWWLSRDSQLQISLPRAIPAEK